MKLKKIIVISGASSGMGYEVTKTLLKQGHTVIGIVRKSQQNIDKMKAILQLGNLHPYYADLSLIKDCKAVSAKIINDFSLIDVLVNNVGGVFSEFNLTEEGLEQTIATNHFSYYHITMGLMPSLLNAIDAKIINVSSNSHLKANINFESFTNNHNYAIMKAYGQSKLANILFTKKLTKILTNKQITTIAFNPGRVRTDIGLKAKNSFHKFAWNFITKLNSISLEKGIQSYLFFIHNDLKAFNGRYFNKTKPFNSSELSQNSALADKLWLITQNYTYETIN